MTIPDFVLAQLSPRPSVWNFYKTMEDAAAAAPEINARESASYQPMTYDDYAKAHDAFYLADPLVEIDAAKWWEMLEVLPPMRWEHKDGVERFLISEMLAGSITSQFAKLGERYFTRNVNAADRSTWITAAEILKHTTTQA